MVTDDYFRPWWNTRKSCSLQEINLNAMVIHSKINMGWHNRPTVLKWYEKSSGNRAGQDATISCCGDPHMKSSSLAWRQAEIMHMTQRIRSSREASNRKAQLQEETSRQDWDQQRSQGSHSRPADDWVRTSSWQWGPSPWGNRQSLPFLAMLQTNLKHEFW